MLKPFRPMFWARIDNRVLMQKVSVEEASLSVLKETIKKDGDLWVKEVLKDYESCQKSVQRWLGRPAYKPKNKKNHALFLRFYRAAKRDLKSKGRISEKTLAMIK